MFNDSSVAHNTQGSSLKKKKMPALCIVSLFLVAGDAPSLLALLLPVGISGGRLSDLAARSSAATAAHLQDFAPWDGAFPPVLRGVKAPPRLWAEGPSLVTASGLLGGRGGGGTSQHPLRAGE